MLCACETFEALQFFSVLLCGHQFHSHCVDKWFEEDQTSRAAVTAKLADCSQAFWNIVAIRGLMLSGIVPVSPSYATLVNVRSF